MSGFHSPGYAVPSGLAWLAAAVVIFATVLAVVIDQPPRVKREGAPPEWFSAERAFDHVEAIAEVPRPWGSPAQEAVIDHIRAYMARFDLEIHEQIVPPPDQFASRGPVHNIAGRMAGSDSTKAVLLMAHHDSVARGPGAADNGAGVATLLETLRALKLGPQLRNDVIFLFTDAEEVCLCGAKAFVESHPWKDDVGVVLNFDGRGVSGPVMMPEASDDNGWIIEQLALAAPYPRANSLMRDVVERMPNSSDLTPFREAGYSAMNFNFIEGYPRYHRATDIPEALSLRTLQHLGEYALPLTRHFGNIDMTETKAGGAAYFNLIGNVFITYPLWWGYIFVVVCLAGYAAALYLGRRHGHLGIGTTLLGAAVFLVSAAAVCGLSYVLVQQLKVLHERDIYWVMTPYLGFFTGIAIMLMAVITSIARLWLRAQDLAMGALLVWLAIILVLAIVSPGAHPLFVWPFLALLLALAIHFGFDDFEIVGTPAAVAFSAAALPALFIFTPSILAFNHAMLIDSMHVTMAFVVLLVGLLTPLLCMLVSVRVWTVPLAGLLIANVFLIWSLGAAEPMGRWAEAEAAERAAAMEERRQHAAGEIDTRIEVESEEAEPEAAEPPAAIPVEDESEPAVEPADEVVIPEPAEPDDTPAADEEVSPPGDESDVVLEPDGLDTFPDLG